MQVELFQTLLVAAPFQAGRRKFKEQTALWVQGTHKTMPTRVPADCVMVGRKNEPVGSGIVVTIADLSRYATSGGSTDGK